MTNTKAADTLLDFLVTEGQPEVAEALVAGSLVVPSDPMRDQLGQARAARGSGRRGCMCRSSFGFHGTVTVRRSRCCRG